MFNSKVKKLEALITRLGLKLGFCFDYETGEISPSNTFGYENTCTENNITKLSGRIFNLNQKVNLLIDYLGVHVVTKPEERYPMIIKNKKGE